MTFKEIVDDALDKLSYDASATTSGPRTRFKRNVNQWHRRILAKEEFSKLRDGWITFATVAGTPRYAMPPVVEQIKRIYDPTNSNPRLLERSPDWLRHDPRADQNQGTPHVWVPLGLVAVGQKPSTTGIWAVSDNAADTTQAIRANVIQSGGFVRTIGPTTLTGTTRVQIGSLTDLVDVETLLLNAACAGTVSIYDDASSGTLLAQIPVGKLYSRYYLIQLYLCPSSVITYTIDYEKKILDLVEDVDEPMLPEDFHPLLSDCCRYEEYIGPKRQLDTAAEILKETIKPRLLELLDHLVNHDDYVVTPDDGRTTIVGSNLGSWFPAGRW